MLEALAVLQTHLGSGAGLEPATIRPRVGMEAMLDTGRVAPVAPLVLRRRRRPDMELEEEVEARALPDRRGVRASS